MATFLALFYTEIWLTCTRAGDFPLNDLNFFKKLTKTEENIKENPTVWPPNFLSFVEGARKKIENHLWYLSERLVPLALYSDNLDLTQKHKTTMMKFKGLSPFAKQEMPFSSTLGKKALKDFVGRDSWTLFQLLDLDSSFLEHPATKWETSESYQKGKHVASNLPVANDAAERALGLATITNTKTAPKSENELQDLYKVNCGVREMLRTKASPVETVTKKSLAAVSYNWLSS